MKKEIREVQGNVMRVTTVDERWYARPAMDPVSGVPAGWDFVPSVTWIAESYPKGIGYYKWLADKGWDEAEAIKEAAGDKGSKVHQAISDLIDRKPVVLDSAYLNPTTNRLDPLTLAEYDGVMGFARWYEAAGRPRIVTRDLMVWNDQHRYAGSIDFCFVQDGYLWLPDAKTSKAIWPSHRLQVSAYRHTPQIEEMVTALNVQGVKLAILQIGYPYNQKRFKFTEIDDEFELFLTARKIWVAEHGKKSPLQKDYPLRIELPPHAEPPAPDPVGQTAVAPPITGITETSPPPPPAAIVAAASKSVVRKPAPAAAKNGATRR